jgi:hypothetical protein
VWYLFFYYIFELFWQCGICFSIIFLNCSHSVVFVFLLYFWTVLTVWYLFFYYIFELFWQYDICFSIIFLNCSDSVVFVFHSIIGW